MATARLVGIRFSLGCWLAAGGAVIAQSPPTFAPPVGAGAFSLSTAAAVLDANRDGSPDVMLPGLFFGTMLTTLDEHGAPLAVNGAGPGTLSFTGPSTPVVLALAAGRIDQDVHEDLVSVTSIGTVHLHRNLGSTRIDRAAFAADVLVDDFHALYPTSVPFVHYSIPVARVADVDLDGFADVVVAGGPVDRWNGATRPGFVAVYRGDGTGLLTPVRRTLAGSPLDVELADLDGNGTTDTIVVLTETGAAGAFVHELEHLALTNGALVATAAPFNLGAGRWTSLAVGDVVGDANHDYVLGQVLPGPTTIAQVCCFQGDGTGSLAAASWWLLPLPANPSACGAFVSAVQLADWNRDGHADLAVLRGFVQPPAPFSTASAVHDASEVLLAFGPGLPWAAFASVPLAGHHMFAASWTSAFAQMPLFAEPDGVRPIDLGRDGSLDLLVTGIRTPGGTSPTAIATLRNLTPPQPGGVRFEKVGAPTGGVPSRPARIGFDGGAPRPGNSSFACTIQNVQGGCLVGLLWGPIAWPGMQTVYGFDVHVAVAQFGCGMLAAGSQPGEGFASFALPIPPTPAIVGDAGYFQWDYWDHAAGVFGGTQATGLWIGN